MDIGSNLVTSFQPQLHSYNRGVKSSWRLGSHCCTDGILVAERRMFYWLPVLYEQRAQLKRLKLLFDLTGGALLPLASLTSFVL